MVVDNCSEGKNVSFVLYFNHMRVHLENGTTIKCFCDKEFKSLYRFRDHFHTNKKHEKESANNFEVIILKNNKRIRRLKDNEEKQINEEIINNFNESK